MTILERILEHKRREVEERRRAVPIGRLEEAIRSIGPPRDFKRAISSDGISLIAEIKRASPSAGVLRGDLDPAELASTYERAGAAAISVITDRQFFMGELDHLRRAREAVGLPVLRKDFIIDGYQVIESRAWGADAVLLIAAALEKERLKELIELVEGMGMTPLVEVHNEGELEAAIEGGAEVIGINNRDLKTFRVSLETTARLAPLIPKGKLVVSESGIKTRKDIERLSELGVDAVLVGEALVRSDDPFQAIKDLFGGELPAKTRKNAGKGGG